MNEKREYAERVARALIAVVEAARWDAHIKSRRVLASAAGMTHTALNARMNGKAFFNVADLVALGAALNVTPGELLRRAQQRAETPMLVVPRSEEIPSIDPGQPDAAGR